MKLLLKTEGLAHIKRGEPELTGFPDLSLHEGEAICIYGKSGSGKGLLLKLAAGLLEPDWGVCKLANVQKSYIFAENGLLHNYTVFDNLMMPLLFSIFQETSEDKVMEALRTFKLLNIKDSIVGSLPEAPKRLIQYARAEVLKPKLLFIEEPLKHIRIDHHYLIKQWLTSFVKAQGGCIFTSTSQEHCNYIEAKTIELSGGGNSIKTFLAE